MLCDISHVIIYVANFKTLQSFIISYILAAEFVCTAPAIEECSGPFQDCRRIPSPNSANGYQDLVCEEDKCRCPNHEYYDYCTCLRK